MTAERLAQIIMDIDPDAAITPSGIELTIEDIPVLVVMAPAADRMRAMVPIASVEDVTPEEMSRMMQANFDTALDARYAVAQDRVWGGVHSPAWRVGTGTVFVGDCPNCEPRADIWHVVLRRCAGVWRRRFKRHLSRAG